MKSIIVAILFVLSSIVCAAEPVKYTLDSTTDLTFTVSPASKTDVKNLLKHMKEYFGLVLYNPRSAQYNTKDVVKVVMYKGDKLHGVSFLCNATVNSRNDRGEMTGDGSVTTTLRYNEIVDMNLGGVCDTFIKISKGEMNGR